MQTCTATVWLSSFHPDSVQHAMEVLQHFRNLNTGQSNFKALYTWTWIKHVMGLFWARIHHWSPADQVAQHLSHTPIWHTSIQVLAILVYQHCNGATVACLFCECCLLPEVWYEWSDKGWTQFLPHVMWMETQGCECLYPASRMPPKCQRGN